MNILNNFEKQLKLVSKFNGVCLNIEEKTKLDFGLKELMLKTKNEALYFWGKITGEDSDYYIAMGVNYKGHYEFPEKIFYYATPNFEFDVLPETFPYHDKDVNDSYYKPLKGNPNLVLKKYKEDIPEGENPDGGEPKKEEENKEGEEGADPNKPANIQDPDASVDDNAPKKEEPKENFTEKLKLSYLVRKIDYDTNIVPEGALKLVSEHEIRVNKSFKGLNKEEISDMSKWMHFRPVSESKKKMLEEEDAVFRKDIFDPITEDELKGSWSLQLDTTKTSCNLRSLLWPGYYACHQGNTNLYCGVYFGNGMKSLELPFMI